MRQIEAAAEAAKEPYVAPRTEVMEVQPEGVLCSSGITGESDKPGADVGEDFFRIQER